MTTTHPCRIARCRDADIDALTAIFQCAIRQIASRDYTPAQINAWCEIERQTWQQQRLELSTWLATIDNDVVGFTDMGDKGHVGMMYVHPAYQRRGVATALLQYLEQLASTQRLEHLFADVSITARPFFERQGFIVLAEQHVERGGQDFTNYKMEKTL